MPRPWPTHVFHFTRIEHLPSIVAAGLLCDNVAQDSDLLAIEIGNTGIKARRRRRIVPVAQGGSVADYVPFYFAPRSPMMYSIHMGNVPGYDEGCGRLIYLVSTVERLVDLGLDVVFSDRNAVLDYAEFACLSDGEPNDDFVDWPLMNERIWRNTPEDPDRRERRMAECLVPGAVPWDAFHEVGVVSPQMSREVADVEQIRRGSVSVNVRPDWYF